MISSHKIDPYNTNMSDTESSIPSSSSDDSSTHGLAKRSGRGFSQPVAVAFTINYLIGTGFLTLPWAFGQGGILLSTITFLFVLTICNISKDYVLSTMARAEAMSRSTDAIDEEGATLLVKSDYGSVDSDEASGDHDLNESNHFGGDTEEGSLALDRPTFDPLDISRKPVDDRYMVKDRKFEYVELCRIFLGNRGEQGYIICIALSIVAQLWGYTTVFSSAMAQMAPILQDSSRDYSIYTILFGSVVVPLTCLDLKEQKTFQLILSGGRLAVIAVMILTCLIASLADEDSTPHFVGTDPGGAGSQLVNFSGFYSMFSVLVFAFMMHNALPVLSEPVADKKHLSSIYLYAFLVCAVAFWTLGFTVSWFFGNGVEQSCNLLWTNYTGGHSSAIWPRAVSYFVVLFPAANIISAYPLNAIVLGNNLLQKLHNQREIEVSKCSLHVCGSCATNAQATMIISSGTYYPYHHHCLFMVVSTRLESLSRHTNTFEPSIELSQARLLFLVLFL